MLSEQEEMQSEKKQKKKRNKQNFSLPKHYCLLYVVSKYVVKDNLKKRTTAVKMQNKPKVKLKIANLDNVQTIE
jgi:hypothetical protein